VIRTGLSIALGALVLAGQPALAAGKKALIVGIADYEELADLEKTLGDARGYAEIFEEQLGYEVTLVENATRRDFLIALDGFVNAIEAGDEVVFVFSGHGWSDRTENYLVLADAPIDAPEALLKSETIPIQLTVLSAIREKKPKVTIAVIDACRDYPFESFTRNAFGRGLARTTASEGMLIFFAAGAGEQALDRLSDDDPEETSVFTRVLLPRLADTNRPLTDIAREVKTRVREKAMSVDHRQNPAYYDELLSDFCFSGACRTEAGLDAEQSAWIAATSATESGESCRLLSAYLDDFPDGQFAAQAKLLSDGLCTEAADEAGRPEIVADPLLATEPDFSFYKTLGSARDDEFRSVAPMEDGGAWFFGSTLQSADGTRNFYAAHLNSRGRMVASASWEDGAQAWGYDAAPARDGGVWVVGGIDRGKESVPGEGISERGHIARLDKHGEVVFSTDLAREGWSRIYGATPDGEGGVWVAGFLDVAGDWQRKSIYVARFDADGELLFERAYEDAMGEQALAIAAKPDGGAYVAGHTRFEDGELSADAFIMEIDDHGEIVWEQRSRFPGYDIALGLDAREDGGFYLAGFTEYEDQPEYGEQMDMSQLGIVRNAFVVSIGPDRSLDWSRTFGDDGTGVRAAVSLGAGKGGWLGGYTTLKPGGGSLGPADTTSPNGYLLRIDGTGEILAQHSFGGEGNDDIIDIARGPNGEIWIAGATENPATNSQDAVAARMMME